MTPEQIAAFNASVGGFFTPDDLLFAIAAITLTLAFLGSRGSRSQGTPASYATGSASERSRQ